MTTLTAIIVLPRGTGPGPVDILDAVIIAPASRTGILWVRNRAPGDLTMTLTIPDTSLDSLGDRTISISVPSGTQRFFALVPKMADQTTGLITLNLSGDTSRVDAFVLERQYP